MDHSFVDLTKPGRGAAAGSERVMLLTLLLACCTSALAGVVCDTPNTGADMAVCAAQDGAAAEERLEATYSRVVAGLHRLDADYAREYPGRPPLQAAAGLAVAQRTWLAFRQQSCHLEELIVLSGNPSRGGPAGTAAVDCQARAASARASDLEAIARAYDIDLEGSDGPSAER